MDQDRPPTADRPGSEGSTEPTWATPAPPSALSQSSLFTEPNPFSRAGSETAPPPPVAPAAVPVAPAAPVPAPPVVAAPMAPAPDPAGWSPYPTAAPAAPTPYGVNPYEPPVNPYPGSYPTPYAGYAPAPYPYAGYAPVQNQKALLALVFGIAGFVLVSAIVGGFIGIAGIVLGRKARREIDAEPQRYSGRAMATAGFWLGLVGVVGSLAYTVGLILLLVFAPDSGF